ncbi:MAG: PBP1A family penicillin-binding protein [Actinomycetota bacterium]|nr:PBP1A family penicillin-binding protein [Actinomycetota bacterium]
MSRRRTILKYVGLGALFAFIALLIVGAVAYAAVLKQIPDPGVKPKGRDQTSTITDRNGEVIAKLFAEQNRTDRPLEEIPTALRQAVIATEDQRFYEHKGVDPLGILRALWVDIRNPKAMHGGSTITQQYVKIAFVTPERSLKRKIMEAILAYRLEKRYSKDQILELYLNTIYFGHGAYGVESAAKTYFGQPVDKLKTSQCAMLAGVIKSPGRHSPYIDPDAARDRRSTVLDQMLELGFADQETHDKADVAKFHLTGLGDDSTLAPYFVEHVKMQLTEEYGSETVYRGGITIKTTLDLRMQKAAEKAISESLDREDDPSAALVAVDPKTGAILAMVGGRDFKTQQFNVATQGRRQPGSSFKPFVLATGLAEGISPEKTFPSGPASFKLPNGQTWKVTGAGGGQTGLMRLRQATEKSVNSVFARLILDVGASDVVATAEKMGLHEGIFPVPAIALGGLEEGVSPLEMASAFGTLANGGIHAEPFAVSEVANAKGDVMFEAEPSSTEAIEPAVAYLTTDILTGVIKRGTGTKAGIGRPAAGKTGTTQEYRDAWFVGYTPDLACAVWVGYAESQKEMKDVHGRAVTGGSFPAEIWKAFMVDALVDTAESQFKKPSGISSVKICTETGLKATEYCPNTLNGLFLANHLPEPCEAHAGPTKIDIPNLIGMAKADALALLKKLSLLFKVVEKDVKGVPAGIVARQSPKAGSEGTTRTVVTIVVSNGGGSDMPPTARFEYGPVNPFVDQPVSFDASASTDDRKIVKYLWEFGDGNEAEGKQVTYHFGSPGAVEVTLWVTDDTGQTAATTKLVTVR